MARWLSGRKASLVANRAPKDGRSLPPPRESGEYRGSYGIGLIIYREIRIHAEFAKRFSHRALESASPIISHPLLDVWNAFGVSWSGDVFVRRSFSLSAILAGPERHPFAYYEWIVWYSGAPIMAGFALALGDLLFLFRIKRRHNRVRVTILAIWGSRLRLPLITTKRALAPLFRTFYLHPMVRRVIVVSNNSVDATFERAVAAGAITSMRPRPVTAVACIAALRSVILRRHRANRPVRRDRTFRAFDIDKLVAYCSRMRIL